MGKGKGRFQRAGGGGVWVSYQGFCFFCGCGGWWVGKGKGKVPASGEEIALGRDREGFFANGDGDGERRTATLRRRR